MQDTTNINDTELAVLAALIRKPLYGFSLVEEVARISDGRVTVTLGGIYPVLHRMEGKGLIEAFWRDESEERLGARRRYYRITGLGESAARDTRNMLSAAFRGVRPAHA